MAKSTDAEREQRILDAAAELFAHFGYDKTTINQIAHTAGLSHGAIYLHFESKDALFEALLTRELIAFTEAWLERIEADPNGGTLGGMYKNMLYTLNTNAFMAAMLGHDRHILGNYMRKPDNFFKQFQSSESHSTRFEFVNRMQEAGALRNDLDPQIITHIMNMLSFSLIGMEGLVSADAAPPLNDLIEGIAFMMDQAFTSPDPDKREIGKAIIRQLIAESRQKQNRINTLK